MKRSQRSSTIRYIPLVLTAAVINGCADYSSTAVTIVMLGEPSAKPPDEDRVTLKAEQESKAFRHTEAIVRRHAEQVRLLRGYWGERDDLFRRYDLGRKVRGGCTMLQIEVNKTEAGRRSWDARYRLEWSKSVKQPLATLLRTIRATGESESNYEILTDRLDDYLRKGRVRKARSYLEQSALTLQVPQGHLRYKLWKKAADLVPDANLPHLDPTVTKEWEGLILRITDIEKGVAIDGRHYSAGDWITNSLKVVSIENYRVHFDYRGCRVTWPW